MLQRPRRDAADSFSQTNRSSDGEERPRCTGPGVTGGPLYPTMHLPVTPGHRRVSGHTSVRFLTVNTPTVCTPAGQ